MSAPRSSLRSFLASAKTNLQDAIINQQRVTLVIGNESADLDSITSAIILAYLRSNSGTSPLTNSSVNKHTPPSQYPPFYIPVINIPRADIKIRPELLALLPHANLEPSYLITLDDLTAEPPAGLNPNGREELQPNLTRLVLVDHNKLAGELAGKGFGDKVIGCIDHHEDEKVVPPDTGSEPRIIKKCGSCTSLVTQFCRQAWDSLSDNASAAGRGTSGQSDAAVGNDDDSVRRTWDAQVAKLAMASILIDTHNLKDESKTTGTDREAVSYLEAKIFLAPGGTGATWDRTAFFDEISQAKSDLNNLTLEEVLRKDYKQWEVKGKQLGISSAVKPLTWQIEKAKGKREFEEVVRQFAEERKLDVYSIMTSSTSEQGEFQRELLAYSPVKDKHSIVETFGKQAEKELKLKPWKEDGQADAAEFRHGTMEIWWQRETKLSRKQVAPLMRKIVGGA